MPRTTPIPPRRSGLMIGATPPRPFHVSPLSSACQDGTASVINLEGGSGDEQEGLGRVRPGVRQERTRAVFLIAAGVVVLRGSRRRGPLQQQPVPDRCYPGGGVGRVPRVAPRGGD